jgi:hypothetical protein
MLDAESKRAQFVKEIEEEDDDENEDEIKLGAIFYCSWAR